MKVYWLNHGFDVYHFDANWEDVGGIYIFTGLSPQNQWVPIYIGKTDSFRNRIPVHEQWFPACMFGATHVHAMVVQLAAMRDMIEEELIRMYQPNLNVQLR